MSQVKGCENIKKADIIEVLKEDKKILKGAEDVQISTLLEAHRLIIAIYI
jgi:hypothetical protein